MPNLHTKVQEANDWRGSAWWLAQRFPKQYGGGRQGKEVEKVVDEVLTVLDRALRSEFNAPSELGRSPKLPVLPRSARERWLQCGSLHPLRSRLDR